jgi:hypothetical protein
MRSDSSNVTEEIGKTGEARKQSQENCLFLITAKTYER